MQSYKRKITYFYQFHNGNVGSTAGFLKLEIRGEKVKIIINIQESPGLPYKGASLYFYHEAGDHLSAVKVDEMESVGDVLTYQNRTDWQQLFDTGRDLYTFDGVAVVYNDDHYYIGDFHDKDRRGYELVRKDDRKKPKKEFVEVAEEVFPQKKAADLLEAGMTYRPLKARVRTEPAGGGLRGESPAEDRNDGLPASGSPFGVESVLFTYEDDEKTAQQQEDASPENSLKEVTGLFTEEQKKEEINIPEDEQVKGTEVPEKGKNIYEKCEDCPYHKKRIEQQEQIDAFEKMIREYPKLPMYGATELFDCVRIHPKDIGKLDMRNWKLGVNSFLSHGFYTYQYLLLGKMRFDDGSEHAIIGVPGVFSNREKYLANMFGFEQFIPVKKTGVKTGGFGYWIVEISPYPS